MYSDYILKDGPCKGKVVRIKLVETMNGWIPTDYIRVPKLEKISEEPRKGTNACEEFFKVYLYERKEFRKDDKRWFEFHWKEDK